MSKHYLYRVHHDEGFPVFAFRLHQFISRGDTVYASPEPEADRYVTLQGQRFVPGADRTRTRPTKGSTRTSSRRPSGSA